jgi:hypothetical protein
MSLAPPLDAPPSVAAAAAFQPHWPLLPPVAPLPGSLAQRLHRPLAEAGAWRLVGWTLREVRRVFNSCCCCARAKALPTPGWLAQLVTQSGGVLASRCPPIHAMASAVRGG